MRAADLYRQRRAITGSHGAQIEVDGQRCLNFCSNDYLGLAADPRLAQALARAAADDGVGSGASALVSGHNREHRALEDELADFLGCARALLFSSGWAVNVGVLRALLGKDDVLIADELNHASLIDGGRLSGARYQRIAHADVSAFAAALARTRAPESHALLVTDGVFSMDGDLAPLPELAALCRAQQVPLMVDDAHGFGVLGARGQGSIEQWRAQGFDLGANFAIDVHTATLGKSLGCAGAFVAGSDELIEFLIQRARSWVFSTAPPPAVAAAARAALRIVRSDEGAARRARVAANIARFRAGCRAHGIDLMASTTPIQPLVVGREAPALAISKRLFEQGFWIAAIRPPTVPKGTARLRITLTAEHSDVQVDALVEALARAWRAEVGEVK
ncbi:8-amino-7-oxononanoate synthase [Sinimarinibacterium sp. NLF-5-8]|nr:8-amino-7-oxononanoate synthase [Sinimarinibacterium sp. NLF-5-8]